ncbi:hypothetical protein WJU23_00780 [Prosthecobacter sp. SYSU 5D2]|uniref:hypothetical protein n=1 Tax=Prosthecobacter sp. SYSU 5D2 TaxID=3134134 RepID=UPI0031FE6958
MNDSQQPSGHLPVTAASAPETDLEIPVAEVELLSEEVLPVLDAAQPFRPPAASIPPPRQPNPLVQAWRRIGGGSLAASILIHVGILLAGGLIVFTRVIPEKAVDFMPGGGSQKGAQASQELAHKVQQKRRTTLTKSLPRQRLVSTSLNTAFTLPDAPPNLLDLPDASAMLSGSGSMGHSIAGMGTGFGKGVGSGGMSGITFGPVTMFGMELKDTRNIAVVMDVSRSMTKYLPAVVAELDKIARQSTLVLYFGCGLTEPKGRIEDEVLKVEGEPFARYWQNWQGKAGLRLTPEERKALIYDPAKPMPLEAIYKKLSGRPNTYFIDFNGIAHTQSALMSDEVMKADTIYWFADFMDAVTEDVMTSVRRKLKYRKQKLIIHASRRGRSFDKVVESLVKPLDGQVVEAEVPN